MFREQKGITLVALVITIIVLLILAGVTIAALSGPNGILTNATNAGQDTAEAEAREAVAMAINTILTNKYAGVAASNVEGSEVYNELTIDNIVAEVNRNYGDKAAAETDAQIENYTRKIKYTTGGYVVRVELDDADAPTKIMGVESKKQ